MDGEVLGNLANAMTMRRKEIQIRLAPTKLGPFYAWNLICQNLVRRKMGFMTVGNHKTLENNNGDPTGNRTRATSVKGRCPNR